MVVVEFVVMVSRFFGDNVVASRGELRLRVSLANGLLVVAVTIFCADMFDWQLIATNKTRFKNNLKTNECNSRNVIVLRLVDLVTSTEISYLTLFSIFFFFKLIPTVKVLFAAFWNNYKFHTFYNYINLATFL